MIKSVTITNYLGESKKIELAYPEKSGYVITSISGLGPVKANILTTELATKDGAEYTSAKAGKRNILFNLKFAFGSSIEYIRQESYKHFPLKKKVDILIETDNRSCKCEGYVESNEPNIFDSSEGTTISVICPDPYLYSIFNQVTLFSGSNPMFEFPFSNESLTEQLIILSELLKKSRDGVYYSGDDEIGMTIKIHFIGPAKQITLYDINKRLVMKIDTDKIKTIIGSDIKNGDDIIIQTTKGKKSILFARDGVNTNILNSLGKNTSWFYLTKGENIFAYEAIEGQDNIVFSIENKIVYEGV